ncbi:unnamed protein product [Caenorhabditis nigoni]
MVLCGVAPSSTPPPSLPPFNRIANNDANEGCSRRDLCFVPRNFINLRSDFLFKFSEFFLIILITGENRHPPNSNYAVQMLSSEPLL